MRAADTYQVSVGMWLLFGAIVVVSLTVDLLAHRGGRGLGRGSAVAWSIVWIVAAFLFAGYIGLALGAAPAGDFVAAYLIEKSLSVDNLFLFLIVFGRLGIPAEEQHRVLYWGIIGALVARALFIAGGTALLARWHDIVYVLGVLLIVTGIKTAFAGPLQDTGESRTLDWLRRHLPVAPIRGHRFFVREGGKLKATVLLVALLTIEASDIMFAIDSVPAVFAVTEQPFIVYSSNVFAILGLRALYLVLAGLLKDLHFLHFGLAAILALAGTKMLVSKHLSVPPYVSLLAIITILIAAIVPSLITRSLRTRARARHARSRALSHEAAIGMHDARSPAMPTRPPHVPRTYEDIARATVPDPDSSWRPSVAEERRAFLGYRAMEPAEQALYDDVHDALLDAGIDTTPLHIEVDRDRVILRGQVHDNEALLRIPGIVGDVPGVSAVIDQLVIAAP